MQFKAGAKALEFLFSIEPTYATIAVGAIVILYTSLGGIKAVTFTDLVQFVTFGRGLQEVSVGSVPAGESRS